MRSTLIILMLLLLLVPGFVGAQGDTDSYVSPDESFSMDIPDDWELVSEGDGSAAFSVPLENPGNPSAEGIVVELDRMGVFFALESYEDETAETVLIAQYEDIDLNFPPGEPVLFAINDMPAAYVDSGADFLGTRSIVVDLSDGQFIVVDLMGTLDQRWLAAPLIFDVLNTLRLEGDDTPVEQLVIIEELGETFTRSDDQLTFDYPAHWLLEEQDSYTLLLLPTGSSIGISGEKTGSHVDNEFIKFVIDDIAGRLEANSDFVVDGEPISFEIDGRPGIRIVGTETGTDVGFTYLVIQLNDDMIAVISAFGLADEVRILQGTLMAIAESVSVKG